jgi:hypothetical protein
MVRTRGDARHGWKKATGGKPNTCTHTLDRCCGVLIVGTPPGYSEFVDAMTPSEKCLRAPLGTGVGITSGLSLPASADELRFAAWVVPVS